MNLTMGRAKIAAKLRRIIRYTLGGVFILSGIGKFISPGVLIGHMEMYFGVPTPYSLFLSLGLAAFELVMGLLIMVGPAARLAIVTAIALTACLSVGQAWLLVRSAGPTECGCFGGIVPEEIGWISLSRNLIIILGLVVLLIGPRNKQDVYSGTEVA